MIDTKELRRLGSMIGFIRDVNLSAYLKSVDDMLTFVTKDEYLAWVTEWRRLYAAMTHEARTGEPIETRRWAGVNGLPEKIFPHYFLRQDRYAMMLLRHAAKCKSRQMRQERLELERLDFRNAIIVS